MDGSADALATVEDYWNTSRYVIVSGHFDGEKLQVGRVTGEC